MKNVIFILACCFFTKSFSQNLSIINQYGFGGSSDDYMFLAKSPNNDGYISIGSSGSDISGNKTENSRGQDDIWVLKLDNNFGVVWDKTIGGTGSDSYADMWFSSTNIYVLATSNSPISGEKTTNSFGGADLWLVCLDYSGNIIWQHQYGGTGGDIASKIVDYSDTSLLITGNSNSGISGNKTTANIGSIDLWLIEVSKATGNPIQEKNIGSTGTDESHFVKINPFTNNIFLGATSGQGISGDKTDLGYGASDIWIVELDQSFNVVNNKCFGGTNTDEFVRSMFFEENSFYITCNSYSDTGGNKSAQNFSISTLFTDTWLLKLDNNLNIIWDKSYGGNKNDYVSSLFKNNNGNIVLGISSNSTGGTGNKTATNFANNEYDLWLLILDGNGTILAQESYGSLSSDNGYVIPGANPTQELIWVSSSNGMVGGVKTVNTYGYNDLWVLEIDASDFLSIDKLGTDNSSVAVYPNPFTSEANFKFRNLSEEVTISFYSVDGRLIDEVKVNPSLETIYTWNNSGSESLILYSIKGETVQYNGKLVR